MDIQAIVRYYSLVTAWLIVNDFFQVGLLSQIFYGIIAVVSLSNLYRFLLQFSQPGIDVEEAYSRNVHKLTALLQCPCLLRYLQALESKFFDIVLLQNYAQAIKWFTVGYVACVCAEMFLQCWLVRLISVQLIFGVLAFSALKPEQYDMIKSQSMKSWSALDQFVHRNLKKHSA